MVRRVAARAALLLSFSGSALAFSPSRLPLSSHVLLSRPHAALSSQKQALGLLVMQEQRNQPRVAIPGKPSLAPLIPALVMLAPTAVGAEPPEWLEDARSSLDIGLALFSLLFFLRIPLTWYPQMDLKKMPQAIVAM